MDLADSFSHEERLEFFRERFRPGVVLKLHCDFTVPPKEKRLIVVSIEPEPLLLVVNSEINEYKQKRPRLKAQQIPITKKECDFLEHDSVIDCSKVRDEFSREDIEDIVVKDTTRILGTINSRIVAEIMTVVDDSMTLEERHKTRIIADLNP